MGGQLYALNIMRQCVAVPLMFRTVLEAMCCSASDVLDSAEGDVLQCL